MTRTFSWKHASLPMPAPLKEAVEAGIFGVCADGSLTPGHKEVAAITEEQARELLSTLYDLRHLNRCLNRHLNPHTRQPLTSLEIREKIERSMQAGVSNLERRYSDCLTAYSEAFGDQAAALLDARVREILELPDFGLEVIEIQRSLF